MSSLQVSKLKSLLGRVQERRAAPRLKAVPAAPEPESTPPVIPEVLRAGPVETAAIPPTVAASLHSSSPPNAARGSDAARSAPTMEDLPPLPPLDSLPVAEAQAGRVSEPAAAAAAPAVKPVPPVLEPPVSAASARIEAQPAAAAEPVLRVVAPPRVETPKNFGELLEISLSLRPR